MGYPYSSYSEIISILETYGRVKHEATEKGAISFHRGFESKIVYYGLPRPIYEAIRTRMIAEVNKIEGTW